MFCVFLLVGIACSLAAPSVAQTVSAATSNEEVAAFALPATPQTTEDLDKAEARRLSKTLFWSLIILIVFTFAAVIIVMFSRRFRAYLGLGGRHHAPTPTDDVWAMHKLPDGAIDELEDKHLP